MSSSPLGASVMKMVKIFKLLSRFRLINIKLGSYLEIFLTTVSKLYPIGGDIYSVKATELNIVSRGKLDLYKVTVVSIEPMAVKYIIYLLSLVVRFYRTSIMKYIKSKKRLGRLDELIEMLGERCQMMLIVVVGIDIFFYSIRCLSHMDRLVNIDMIGKTSLLVSALTLVCITYEFIIIISANRVTTFFSLRKAFR